MATVATKSYQSIEIKTVDADWTAPERWSVESIGFKPGAANDKIAIFDGAATGPEVAFMLSADGEYRVKYFDPPKNCKPMIDLSESTLSAGHKIVFELTPNW